MALGLIALRSPALALAACGSDDQPGDKKITVYSGRTESLVKPMLEQFQSAVGITVEVRYADSAAMAAQLLEEGEKSPADVFLSQDAGALGAVAKQGLFATLPSDVLAKVPATYRARSGAVGRRHRPVAGAGLQRRPGAGGRPARVGRST